MLLDLTDLSDEPLHEQISRQIRARILSGALESESSLPSIRGLARDTRVSVITVQRAYEDLDREGLIRARRGKGFFVLSLDESEKTALARRRLREAVEPMVDAAVAEGLSTSDVRAVVASIIREREEDPT